VRRIVVPLLLLVLPVLAPGSAAAPKPSGFAGRTTITSVGSAAVSVVTGAFTLSGSPGAVHLTTTGGWVALLIVEQKKGGYPFDNGYRAANSLDVFGKAPHGCTDDGNCYGVAGYRTAYRESRSTTPRPNAHRDVHFPAGRYVAYLLTDPGARASAVVTAGGVAGRATMHATRPVRALTSLQRSSALARVQHQSSFPFVLRRPGAVFARVWSVDSHAVPGGDGQFALCLTRGLEQAEPPLRDATCPAELVPLAGAVPVLPTPPEGAATCGGGAGVSLPGSNASNASGCGLDFLRLEPAGYRSRWAVGRSGLTPAAGYVGVALEYLKG